MTRKVQNNNFKQFPLLREDVSFALFCQTYRMLQNVRAYVDFIYKKNVNKGNYVALTLLI